MDAVPGIKKNEPERQLQAPVSAELVLHSCGISVAQLPDGQTLLRLVTPFGLAVSVKFDEGGREALITQMKGSNIQVARPGQVPGL